MKTNNIILLAAAALLFVNCAREEIDVTFKTGTAVAVMETEDTKSDVTDNGYFTWTEGDKIAIHTNNGILSGTLSEGKGTPDGTFSYSYVDGQEPTGYAMYPYSAKHSVSESVVSFHMPATYDLNAAMSNTNAPMLAVPTAKTDGSVNYSFSHLGGVIRVVFKNAPVGTDKFTLSLGGAKINGDFTVEDGMISSTADAEDGENLTTLNFTALTSVQDITLFVPVPTGKYTGIEAKLYKGEDVLGTWGAKSATNNIERRALVLMAPITFSNAGGNIENNQNVATEKQLKDAVANGGYVTLTENITGVSELLKVEKDLVLDLNGYTLAFTPQTGYPGIKNTANLEVKNGTITSTQVGIQNNGILVINCNVETVGNAINNVYDGETTINGGTYKNTSDQKALIYSDNYENGTPVLNINGGTFESVFTNVSYNNGSTGAVNGGVFKCTGGWHNIYVGGSEGSCNVTYDAAVCEFESNGINVQVNNWGVENNKNTLNNVEYTGVHNISYASGAESLESAVSVGGEVILTGNITLDETLVLSKPVTLDGNSFTLTSNSSGTTGRAINVSGADGVIIKNLTIEAKGERAINIIQKATNVTIDNVTATAANYTVNVATSAPSAVVNIEKSALTGLNVVNVAASDAAVTISDTKLVCNDQDAGENYAALKINKEGTKAKITATGVTFDIKGDSVQAENVADGGSISINGQEVVADAVAIITYPGPYYYSFRTLNAAIEKAKVGETVTLIRDIEITELIKVEKAITIDLNEKTVTAKCKKAFEIYASATIKNGTILSQQRCVDTRKAVDLTLTNVKLEAPTYYSAYGNQQPLTIGGSEGGTKIQMNDVTIDAGYQGYCIISFVKTELTAKKSVLKGYSALYVKEGSENSNFKFIDSDLTGTTGDNDVEDNSFATIVIEANNVTVNMDEDCELNSVGNHHRETFIKDGVTGSTITGPIAK